MRGAADRRVYVYALAEPGLPRRLRLRGHALHAIAADSADAIVERRAERLGPTTEALEDQHAVIVALAERARGLLPVRFGSLVAESELRTTLSTHAAAIEAALARVRDRAQMTVRVFGEPDAGRPTDDRTSGARFLDSRRRQARYEPPEASRIRQLLGDLAAAERIEPGRRGVRFTLYHLVDREDVKAYAERAVALPAQLAPHRAVVTGPWPAFAFSPELF